MSRIFIIGFMGCGKTSWGKKLAAASGYDFIDLDHLLEEKTGLTVAEFFAANGEPAFRQFETALLKQTPYPQNAIISTGGGLPCFFDNMDWMNSNGQTVYIKLSPKTLADRLANARVKRPLVQGKQGDELIEFITEKLAERAPYYERASHILDGINLSVELLMNTMGEQ